ncbi:MAG: hypothetical protein AAFU77_05570 [Myxococcota bacterium]
MLSLTLLLALSVPAGELERPVDVFKSLDGAWSGEFVGYGADGKDMYRIAVEQRYRTVDANRQAVEIRDVAADGSVTRGTGFNIATRRPDGSLELICEVTKDNGESVRHQGRRVTGADGSESLVWYSVESGKSETFRETVRGNVYEINGMGLYGSTAILMHGVYRRAGAETR